MPHSHSSATSVDEVLETATVAVEWGTTGLSLNVIK